MVEAVKPPENIISSPPLLIINGPPDDCIVEFPASVLLKKSKLKISNMSFLEEMIPTVLS